MADVAAIFADTDQAYIADTDGAVIVIGGDLVPADPPPPPDDVRHNRGTGELTWTPSDHVEEYRIYRGDGERAVRAQVATLSAPPHVTVAVSADDIRSWQVRAYNPYVDEEGPPSKATYARGSNQKL